MSIPSLVEGTGNNEARRVPNETNIQPLVPTLRQVLWKFGIFSSPSIPLYSTSLALLRSSYACACRSCAPLDVVVYYDTLPEITFNFRVNSGYVLCHKGLML